MTLKNREESLLFEDLRDPAFAAEYLEEMLEEDDIESFLHALRNIAKANGGIAKISKKTKLGRESMYKTLSENGNPHFSTLHSILRSLGLRFSIAVE